VVPDGQTCILFQTTVTGNVMVRGTLSALFVVISGNLIGEQAESLGLDATTVGGNLVAVQTSGGPSHLCNSTIGGSVIVLQSSSSAFWNIGYVCDSGGLTVGLNLIFSNNTGGGFIAANTIGGNLDCNANTPAPTKPGSDNIVGGSKKGQCANF